MTHRGAGRRARRVQRRSRGARFDRGGIPVRRGVLRVALGLAFALAACHPDEKPIVPWLYDAPLPLAPRPPTTGEIGRGTPPLVLDGTGIFAGPGIAGGPLAVKDLLAATAGPAVAMVFGELEHQGFLELVDVDAGVVRWRRPAEGMKPRALTAEVAVIASAEHVVGLDPQSGAIRWQRAARFLTEVAGRWIGGTSQGLVVVDSSTGAVVATAALPVGLPEGAVIAACDKPGLHLWAWHDAELSRWDLRASNTLQVAWTVPTARPKKLEACGPEVLLLDDQAVRALDPATGAVIGGPVAARDIWPARVGGGIEVATAAGLEARDVRLQARRPLEPVVAQRLLAHRGDQRIVLQDDRALALLDPRGVRPLTAGFGAARAALGTRYLVTGTWGDRPSTGAARLTRWALPTPGPSAPNEILPAPLLGDAPRIDVPPLRPLPDAEVVLSEEGVESVESITVDPADPERVYFVARTRAPGEGGDIYAFDLHRNLPRWPAPAACPRGEVRGLAIAGESVVCASEMPGEGAVRAVRASDGKPAWEWSGEGVDQIGAVGVTGPGDVVVVSAGARMVILDGATGEERASARTSDGYPARFALARRSGDTLIASFEYGRVVFRSARLGLRPMASIQLRGSLERLFAVGDRIAAALSDGTLYLLSDDGRAIAAGAWSREWDAAGDLGWSASVDERGIGTLLGIGTDGLTDLFWSVTGVDALRMSARGAPGAPWVMELRSSGTSAAPARRAIVLSAHGTPDAGFELPGAPTDVGLFSTVVHGESVVGAFSARPLRFVRLK